jgi:hypothetical protein
MLSKVKREKALAPGEIDTTAGSTCEEERRPNQI